MKYESLARTVGEKLLFFNFSCFTQPHHAPLWKILCSNMQYKQVGYRQDKEVAILHISSPDETTIRSALSHHHLEWHFTDHRADIWEMKEIWQHVETGNEPHEQSHHDYL